MGNALLWILLFLHSACGGLCSYLVKVDFCLGLVGIITFVGSYQGASVHSVLQVPIPVFPVLAAPMGLY